MARKYSKFKDILYYNLCKYCPPFFYPLILQIFYIKFKHSKLNLKSPKKLSEKIQWLKLYDNNELMTFVTNKIEAKKYIKNLCPDLKFAKIYQIKNHFKDLNFDELPNSFVIKTNNASKTNIIIRNKKLLNSKNKKILNKYFESVLNVNFAFVGGMELQYKNIEPKIFVEEYLEPPPKNTPSAYEVWCFNGEPEFFVSLINMPSENWPILTTGKVFDFNFNELNYEINLPNNKNEISKIKDLNKLYKYSKLLSEKFKFARIDYFVSNNDIYFGEITFSPASGYFRLKPENLDLKLGQLLKLN